MYIPFLTTDASQHAVELVHVSLCFHNSSKTGKSQQVAQCTGVPHANISGHVSGVHLQVTESVLSHMDN